MIFDHKLEIDIFEAILYDIFYYNRISCGGGVLLIMVAQVVAVTVAQVVTVAVAQVVTVALATVTTEFSTIFLANQTI